MKVKFNGAHVEVPYSPLSIEDAYDAWGDVATEHVFEQALNMRANGIALRLLTTGKTTKQVAEALKASRPGTRIKKTEVERLRDRIAKLSKEEQVELNTA